MPSRRIRRSRRRTGERVLVDPALYRDDSPDAPPVGGLGSEADGGFAQYVTVYPDQTHDVTDSPLTDQQLPAARGCDGHRGHQPGQGLGATGWGAAHVVTRDEEDLAGQGASSGARWARRCRRRRGRTRGATTAAAARRQRVSGDGWRRRGRGRLFRSTAALPTESAVGRRPRCIPDDASPRTGVRRSPVRRAGGAGTRPRSSSR